MNKQREIRLLGSRTAILITANPHDASPTKAFCAKADALGDPCSKAHSLRIEGTRLRLLGRFDVAEDLIRQVNEDCVLCEADSLRRLAMLHIVRGHNNQPEHYKKAGPLSRRAQEIFNELANSSPHAYVLHCLQSAAMQAEAEALFFLSRYNEASRLYRESVQLACERNELHPKWWGRCANSCASLPTHDLKTVTATGAIHNLCVTLAYIDDRKALAEAVEIFPTIVWHPRRDRLNSLRLVWLEARILASTVVVGAGATTKAERKAASWKRQQLKRKVVLRLNKAYTGILKHGSAEDAVMVLTDFCTLPWIKDQLKEVRLRFSPGLASRRDEVEACIQALDPVIAEKIKDLQVAADSRSYSTYSLTLGRLDDLRDTLANGGAAPPFKAWTRRSRRTSVREWRSDTTGRG